MRRAHYAVVSNEAQEPLVIRDVGPWDQHPTITNDAEAVVADLFQAGLIPGGRRVFYFDSENNLDELRHEEGRFLGFQAGRFS